MKKLTLIADVLLISLSAGLFLPNSTINMAKYQSDNNKSLITEKDNITPEEVKGEFKHGILTLNVPKKEAKPAVETNKYIAIEG